MAKFYKFFFLLTSCLFFLTSCQEGGDAGDLLGQWRMDRTDDQYISFSGGIVWLQKIPEKEVGIFGNFQRQGDSLFIQCYSAEGLRSDTTMVEDSFGFKPFNNIRLKIETLDGDVLLLSKDNQKWSFYKY
jgi:hypothetical protein